MGNAIQTMSGAQIEAAFHRDLYLVTCSYKDSGYFNPTDIEDATLARLVEDLWSGDVTDVVTITKFNRERNECCRADLDVARAVAAKSEALRQTPHDKLREWLEELGVSYFEDDEFLREGCENAKLIYADFRRDLRVQASGAR